MHKKYLYILLIVIIALFTILGAYYWFMNQSTPEGGQPPLPTQTIIVGTASVTAELAQSDEARKTGLSGRASLPEGRGMLFVFPEEGNWGIWMKEMNFPIDIMWADSEGKIVAMQSNISPETYPTSFYPNNDTRYVLEVPAGFAAKNSIKAGDSISLPQ
jgi:uncharacterized protein